MSTVLLTWEDDSGDTIAVRFDVVTSENHEGTQTVTDYPVEEGVDATDHARPGLDTLSIEGLVSNTPLYSNPGVEKLGDFAPSELDLPDGPGPRNLTGLVSAGISALTGGAKAKSATVLQQTEFKDRVRATYEALQDARTKSRMLRVETSLREYENMLALRVATPRTAEDGKSAKFQVDLREVRTVKLKTVDAPIPAEPRGAIAKALGSKTTKKDDEQTAEQKRKSLAAKLVDGGAGLVGGMF